MGHHQATTTTSQLAVRMERQCVCSPAQKEAHISRHQCHHPTQIADRHHKNSSTAHKKDSIAITIILLLQSRRHGPQHDNRVMKSSTPCYGTLEVISHPHLDLLLEHQEGKTSKFTSRTVETLLKKRLEILQTIHPRSGHSTTGHQVPYTAHNIHQDDRCQDKHPHSTLRRAFHRLLSPQLVTTRTDLLHAAPNHR